MNKPPVTEPIGIVEVLEHFKKTLSRPAQVIPNMSEEELFYALGGKESGETQLP